MAKMTNCKSCGMEIAKSVLAVSVLLNKMSA